MNKRDVVLRMLAEAPGISTNQIHNTTGISRRHIRRIKNSLVEPKPEEKKISAPVQSDTEDKLIKLYKMTGFKKSSLPVKYRLMVADLVMEIENNLNRKIDIEIKSDSRNQAAVLLLSDIHAGKRVHDDKGNIIYDRNVCAYRLSLLKARTIHLLTKHLHLERFDEFAILLLGDIIDGSGIYPNQELNQDLSCFTDQIALAVAGIWDLILDIAKLGLKISIYGCPGNHGRCLSNSMELLTKSGWKSYSDLEEGEIIPTLTKDGFVEYKPIEKIHIFNTDKTIFRTSSKNSVGLEVTGDHTLWTYNKYKKIYDSDSVLHLKNKVDMVYIPKVGISSNKDVSITDDMLKLIGIILADGSIRNRAGKSVEIYIYQSKPNVSSEIEKLLLDLDISYSKSERLRWINKIMGVNTKENFTQNTFYLKSCRMKNIITQLLPSKKIQDWMYGLSDRQVKILLEGIKLGDGSSQIKTFNGYNCIDECVYGSKEFLDSLQGLLVTHGKPCTLSKNKRGDYILQLLSKSHRHYDVHTKDIIEDNYNDITWCVTVDNHSIFVRNKYNGRCFIVGNTYKYAPVNNNFDYLVYQMLYMLAVYEDTKIQVTYSTTTPYMNFTIKDHNIHIRHEAPSQVETPAAKARFSGWKDIHKWNIMCSGHNHHPANNPFMDAETFQNGSFEAIDDLAESMSVFSRPSQTLFGIDSELGVTFSYKVYLDAYGKSDEYDKLMEKYPIMRGK